MEIREVVDTTLLVVVTLLSVGRWVQAREDKDALAEKDLAARKSDLDAAETRHTRKHERIWEEISHIRDWQQEATERIAVVESTLRLRDRETR